MLNLELPVVNIARLCNEHHLHFGDLFIFNNFSFRKWLFCHQWHFALGDYFVKSFTCIYIAIILPVMLWCVGSALVLKGYGCGFESQLTGH